MNDILTRLKAATGPDRELDAMIAVVLQIMPSNAFQPSSSLDPGTFATGAYTTWRAPDWTSSIDVALALVERMLPGWDLQLFNRRAKGGWMARLRSPSYDLYCTNVVDREERRVPTAPVAILCALFTALSEKDKLPRD